jgi:predicted dienelactone hydrolase
MARDYFQRRRHKQRITSGAMVAVLGGLVAWALTRQPGTPAFPVGESSLNAPSADFATRSEAPQQEIADAALRDNARGADLHVRLLLPKAGGKLPVIIFYPDGHDSEDCCEALIRDWASHGYAIVEIVRVAALQTESQFAMESVRLKRATKRVSVGQFGSGALDVTSVIDSLPALQTRFPAIRGKLDIAHIGVVGNGAGAVAAEAIAGAVVALPGRPRANLADPRVRAVLCISPQGPGQSGFTEHSFDQLVLPYLGITGDRDIAPAKFAAVSWHKAPFERSQPGDKYELFVRGGNGTSLVGEQYQGSGDYTQNAGASDSTAGHIHAATLAFWDGYLRHDVAAKRYLESDALEKTGRGVITLERR